MFWGWHWQSHCYTLSTFLKKLIAACKKCCCFARTNLHKYKLYIQHDARVTNYFQLINYFCSIIHSCMHAFNANLSIIVKMVSTITYVCTWKFAFFIRLPFLKGGLFLEYCNLSFGVEIDFIFFYRWKLFFFTFPGYKQPVVFGL
jgi:hypothetical protein